MSRFLATMGLGLFGMASLAASAGCPPGAQPDEAILERVKAALHADPYFYDRHVTVSMQHGNVVLEGIVFGEWDLRDALRIANGAACGRRVIDELKIETGGRR